MFEVVDEFSNLGSNIYANLLLDKEIDRSIGKAATAMAKPTGSGKIGTLQGTPRFVSTRSVYSALYFMAANHGPPTCDRSTALTPSTCTVSSVHRHHLIGQDLSMRRTPTSQSAQLTISAHLAPPETDRTCASHGQQTYP